MREYVIRWVGNALILLVIANAMQGEPGQVDPVAVHGIGAAFLAVALVAVFNLILQPLCSVVKTLGCLVNLLSMGLFGLVVSFLFWALAFYVVGDWMRPLQDNFRIDGFGNACVAAFWMALGNGLLSMALHQRDDDQKDRAA